MIRKCEVCGREFLARRSTARFCSATCRSRSNRGYAYEGELLPPTPSAAMSEEEVAGAVQAAHIAAEDLSRAALMTPAPLCGRLGRAAKAMEDALRREGL